MSTIDDTVDRLRALAREISIAELARRAGVPDSTLRAIFDPDWNPRRITLAACARVLETRTDETAAASGGENHQLDPCPITGKGASAEVDDAA